MRPSDLLEFNRRHACGAPGNGRFPNGEAADLDLSEDEIALLQKLPAGKARVVLFGDGREGPALARRGNELTLIKDFHSEAGAFTTEFPFRDRAPASPGAGGLGERYDTAWLGGIFYSKIPGREIRVDALKRIGYALKPGGHLVCQFLLDERLGRSRAEVLFRRIFAYLTLGNFRLQNGDAIREAREFSHTFSSWSEFKEEIQAAGFEMVFSQSPPAAVYGGAIARIKKFA